jgi:anti-sigma regulatory factor (Ser/Thr protein kinase)
VGHGVARGPRVPTEHWVRAALDSLARLPHVHRVGLAVAAAGGRQLSFTATDRDGGHIDWCDVDAYDDVPLNNTVRSGRLIFGSLAELGRRYSEFVGRQSRVTKALATAPLTAGGPILGGFALFYDTGQTFDEAQLEQLRRLGERLGERLGTELHGGRRTETLPHRVTEGEPLPDGSRAATHVVDPDPEGVSAARHFAWDTLTSWGIDADARDSAVLCVSELVTNALIHTLTGCEVRLVLHHGVLTTSVRDGGAQGRLDSAGDDPLASHGRGLRLVDALSTRWGSRREAVGMTVWCELETTARQPQA